MKTRTTAQKMPELMVLVRLLAIGFWLAEVWRLASSLGKSYAQANPNIGLWAFFTMMVVASILGLAYACLRGSYSTLKLMLKSRRVDFLIALVMGSVANRVIGNIGITLLDDFHGAFIVASPDWALLVLGIATLLPITALVQYWLSKRKAPKDEQYLMTDKEIDRDDKDLLGVKEQAKAFAEVVMRGAAQSGLVFGIDGAWGAGKTSFINLAAQHWAQAEDEVIVCRFEPLRYAAEVDLPEKLIQEVISVIQSKAYAPEFRSVASRYARWLKGKAEFSYFGFNLALEPASDTVDELLEDIDWVLKCIKRRIIIVIDDLDRLDHEAINRVLFATQRTFSLTQACYVLCYDTAMLLKESAEAEKARHFLEKFITVKRNLIVNLNEIRKYLKEGWVKDVGDVSSVSALRKDRVSRVLKKFELSMKDGGAIKYECYIGDLRKVKRLVNTMIIIALEKINWEVADFNEIDFVHLLFLYLVYPEVFREVYLEETSDASGVFSLKRKKEGGYVNADKFKETIARYPDNAQYVLKRLFDAEVLGTENMWDRPESDLAARACFNEEKYRSLTKYLKAINNLELPRPEETYAYFNEILRRIKKGESVSKILSASFDSEKFQNHKKFWRQILTATEQLTGSAVDNVLDGLIELLPEYPNSPDGVGGLRQEAIYTLIRLLDKVGWTDSRGLHEDNADYDRLVEIAWRIYGEGSYENNGIMHRLITERGVLGWRDLMLFRLQCSTDRGGQVGNIFRALGYHKDKIKLGSGEVKALAKIEMREISQWVFSTFKVLYIDNKKNFYQDVENTPDEHFFISYMNDVEVDVVEKSKAVHAIRNVVTSFVIYQLCNRFEPTGAGAGCGLYDETGGDDQGGIAQAMNEYVFGFCFNPEVKSENLHHFLYHCLTHLTNSFFTSFEVGSYVASKADLVSCFDPKVMAEYWLKHQDQLRELAASEDREVVTASYTATYKEDLPGVFKVLDDLVAGLGLPPSASSS